jgi:hypothetical protein
VTEDAPQIPGHVILDDVEAFIRRFVVMPADTDYQSFTVWTAHTWIYKSFDVSPRGALLSDVGEYGVGKTRAMEVGGLFCANFRMELDPTGPALAAMITQLNPTLGIDETDTIFGARGSSGAKRQLRGILNSGYKAGARMSRRSKNDFVEDLVFCPVLFAGAANLPESLTSRSVIWRMKRRRPEQKIDQWFPRMHVPEGKALGEVLGQWAGTIAREASLSWPDLPEGIEDRASEIWWPLLAIADAAGGEWPRKIREACRAMVLREAAEAKPPPASQLLSDMAAVWPHTAAGVPEANAGTASLLQLLTELPGAPWASIWSEEAAPREMSALLAGRGIAPRKVKTGNPPRALQGYRWIDVRMAAGVPEVPPVPHAGTQDQEAAP